MSNKIKRNNETSKIFIGYMDDTGSIVTPLFITRSQMSGWIKYFETQCFNSIFKTQLNLE